MIQVPQVGDSLGRYRLREELGRGGMAVVYRAEDALLGREVAIKVLHAHLSHRGEHAARFVREAKAVAALKHPNIVEIYDFGEGNAEEGQPSFIVSELIQGTTLRAFIDRHGHPFPEVAAMLVHQLTLALACAHQHRIIHRDLKPENVMIAEGGRVVLTDFGIARVAEGETVTETGALLGSPAYMSPEQARGSSVDSRSDLFSLGVILYQLCTGQLPFPGKDPISTVLRIVEGHYLPAGQLNPQIGSRLDRLIQQLLAKTPEQRPQTAEEVQRTLEEAFAELQLGPVEQELRRYFAGPGDYNGELGGRVVERSLELAAAAARERNYPVALALCDRVLSFAPRETRALELMSTLSRGGARRRISWTIGLVTALALVGSAGAFWWHRARPQSIAPEPLHLVEKQPLLRDQGTRPDTAAPRRDLVVSDHAALRVSPKRRRRPLAQSTTPLPRDGGASSLAPVRPPDSRVVPRPTYGELVVRIGPWCDLVVDGRPRGRSPLAEPLRLAPGEHELSCQQGPGGPRVQHKVLVEAGKTYRFDEPLARSIRVKLQLRYGDGVRIDEQIYRGAFELAPKRYRVDVVRGAAVVEGHGAWVSFPSRPCTLVDEPRLVCR